MVPKICSCFEKNAQTPSAKNAIFDLGLRFLGVIFAILLGLFAHWAQAATYADPRPVPQLDNAVPIVDAIRNDNLDEDAKNPSSSLKENEDKNSEKKSNDELLNNVVENNTRAPEASEENPLPIWAQWVVGIFVVAGAAIALLGSLGLLRLRTYYERVHAPSIIATMGCWLTMWAVIIFFHASGRGAVFSLLLIAIFLGVTVPITTIFLMRAALFRSRRAGENVPPSISRTHADQA